ncbi:hypothetical protein [Clostridium perfringens]
MKHLGIKKWECPRCETLYDRDINVSKNLLNLAI